MVQDFIASNPEIRFPKPLDLESLNELMNYIGNFNSQQYDISWRYHVEKSVRQRLDGKGTLQKKDIGRVIGQITTPNMVTVEFECPSVFNEEGKKGYAGILFSRFNKDYHPGERAEVWNNTERSVKNYFQKKDLENEVTQI